MCNFIFHADFSTLHIKLTKKIIEAMSAQAISTILILFDKRKKK